MQNNQNPVFILGSPRSGTSLMREILRHHPTVFVPVEETRFMYRIWGNRYIINKKLGSNPKKNEIAKMLRNVALVDIFRNEDQWGGMPINQIANQIKNKYDSPKAMDILNGLMDAGLKEYNKTLWGEKTPEHTLMVDQLYKLFPKAYFIFMIRDGREVTASLYKRNNLKRPCLSRLLLSAATWKIYARTIMNFQKSNLKAASLTVKLEDLTSNPEKNMVKICDFLSIPYNKKMLEFTYSNSAYEDQKLKQRNKTGISPVHSKWKQIILPNHQNLINWFLQSELFYYGYFSHKHDNILNTLPSKYYSNLWWFTVQIKNMLKKAMVNTGYNAYLRKVLDSNPWY
jgi:hypothetical protein